MPDKGHWADWLDDRTTDADNESVHSMCDEPEDFEVTELELAENEPTRKQQPARKLTWAELVDSETEDETCSVDAEGGSVMGDAAPETAPPTTPERAVVAPAARWADISESEEEFIMEGRSSHAEVATSKDLSEHEPARASRASRRARAARAAAANDHRGTAAGEDEAGWQSAAGKRGAAARSVPHGHDAAPQGKASGKGGTGKASDRGDSEAGKAGSKGAGKGAAKGADKSYGHGVDKGTGKGAGKSAGKSAGKGAGQGPGKGKGDSKGASGKGKKGAGKGFNEPMKFQCQIVVGIEEDNKFRVVRRLIGNGGENMKNINQQSDAKLRLRGRGSGFLEGEEQKESTDDLMLCISAHDKAGYATAKAMASELIEGIHKSFRAFCHKAGKACPDLTVQIHEGYREGSR